MKRTLMRAPFDADVKAALVNIGSRKRSAFVSRTMDLNPMSLHSYWDSDSRALYVVMRGEESFRPPTWGGNFERTSDGSRNYVPQAGDALIEYGTELGKESIPYIIFFLAEAV